MTTTTVEKIVAIKRWTKEIKVLKEEMEGSLEALDFDIILHKLEATEDRLQLFLKHEFQAHGGYPTI